MTDAGVYRFKLMVVSDLQLLQLTLQRGAGRFAAIVGPSGSGKSSLLHAGLLPRLQRQPERWMLLPPLVPGRQPMRNLARALAATFASTGDPRSVDDLEASLRRGASLLVELALQLTARRAGQQKVLVVVDQAEELVTLTGVREQHEFLRLLDGAMSEDSPMWAVATVRSEFLSTAPERAGLAEAVHESVVVEPLSRSRLWDVASLRPRGEPLKGHTQSVYKVSFSRDGRLLASASIDGTVRLWDLPTGRPHGRPLIGHTNWVHSVAFSPYGKLLASSSKDQTIRLRDVATGRAHGPPITGHTGEVWGRGLQPRRQATRLGQCRPDRSSLGRGHKPGGRPAAHRPHRNCCRRGVQSRRRPSRHRELGSYGPAMESGFPRMACVRLQDRRSQSLIGRLESVCPGTALRTNLPRSAIRSGCSYSGASRTLLARLRLRPSSLAVLQA